MCAVALGAVIAPGVATATQAVVGAAIIGATAAVGTAIYSGIQQSRIAQANLNAQARAQQINMEMSRQQMQLQQDQSSAALALQVKQSADQYNLSVLTANNQMANQYRQQRQATLNERAFLMKKNESDRNSYYNSVEEAKAQNRLSNEGANRSYIQAQQKLDEKRKQARFEQQAILSKAIGARGNILATGRAGQSVGLLAQDVERQKGFSLAQTYATMDSARDAATVEMEAGFLKSRSEINQAFSQVDLYPSDPYLPRLPSSPDFIRSIGLGINT